MAPERGTPKIPNVTLYVCTFKHREELIRVWYELNIVYSALVDCGFATPHWYCVGAAGFSIRIAAWLCRV